jgi:hypothetical protein
LGLKSKSKSGGKKKKRKRPASGDDDSPESAAEIDDGDDDEDENESDDGGEWRGGGMDVRDDGNGNTRILPAEGVRRSSQHRASRCAPEPRNERSARNGAMEVGVGVGVGIGVDGQMEGAATANI